MSEERRAVTPIRPAAAYIGGKRRLGGLLARRIEAVPHETYAEPFVGMGAAISSRIMDLLQRVCICEHIWLKASQCLAARVDA
jgi:hypothetical protein